MQITIESHLVGSLVELLGIERTTEAQGDTLAEKDVVGQSGDTAVVNLDLFDNGVSLIVFLILFP